MTPSSDMNRPAVIFLIAISSDLVERSSQAASSRSLPARAPVVRQGLGEPVEGFAPTPLSSLPLRARHGPGGEAQGEPRLAVALIERRRHQYLRGEVRA